MRRDSLLPGVAVLVLLLAGAGAFLAAAPTSGSDDLLLCSELPPLESVVTLAEGEKKVVRLCIGSLGEIVQITSEGTLIELDEDGQPLIEPEEPEGP